MIKTANRFAAIGAFILATAYASQGVVAQNDARQKPNAGVSDKGADGVARYCDNVAPAAAEARVAWETKRLTELQGQITQRIADLDAKEAEARDWVAKRETMMNTASADVVAIYAKMDPQAAAAQMASMDEAMAAAILSKLNARNASAIFNEMDAAKASKLTGLISGAAAPGVEKKS